MLIIGGLFGKLSGRFVKKLDHPMGHNGDDFNVSIENDLTVGVLLCILATSNYFESRRCGFDIRAVSYEDLVAHPLEMCRVILE